MTQAKEMEMDIVRHSGCSVVHVSGDINWRTSPELRSAILALIERQLQRCVIVDLAGTTHLDSSGISSFVEALITATKRGARFLLHGLSEPSRRALELTRLAGLFEVTTALDLPAAMPHPIKRGM